MKKRWEKGILPMIISGAVLAALLIFQSEIRIEDWPLPIAVSRTIMIAILALLIFGLVFGYRRYSAWKKAEDARQKVEYGRHILKEMEEEAAKNAGEREREYPGYVPAEDYGPSGETGPARVSAEKDEAKAQNSEGQAPAEPGEPNVKKPKKAGLPKEMLDDVSYIRDSHHTTAGPWQQYDYLLASRPFGWGYMVSQADYMAGADLQDVGTVTVAEMANMQEEEMIESFRSCGNRISDMQELKTERGQLAVGGMSRVLGFCPVKIVWFNQTNVFRIFTIPDNDEMMLRYAETVIRRTFGTPDAMKKAKPVPAPRKRAN